MNLPARNLSVGFTGTKNGATDAQQDALHKLLLTLAPSEAHHGDCVGADTQFHEAALSLEARSKIHIHPPSDPKARAYCDAEDVVVHEAKSRLAWLISTLTAGNREDPRGFLANNQQSWFTAGYFFHRKKLDKLFIHVP